jgi:hypothetical protein
MKEKLKQTVNQLSMSGKEFDKIMRGALKVHPPVVSKKKRSTKKAARKKN